MRENETFGDLLKVALKGNEFATNCVLQQIDPIVRHNSNIFYTSLKHPGINYLTPFE